VRNLKTLASPIFLCLLLAVCTCQAQNIQTRHVRRATQDGTARFLGSLSSTQTLHLVIALPLRNQDELDQLIGNLYDPTSSSYHKFLTVDQFTEEFGPTQQDYDSVVSYLEANGLAVTDTSPNRMTVQVTGSAAHVQAAFHVRLGVYQHPTENRAFYAPDREPTTDLSISLWHVDGLDNFSTPKPAGLTHIAQGTTTTTSEATTGSGPSASFLASDMRAAYYGGTLTGSGQTLGLVEYYGTDLADLQTYYTNAGQTYPGSTSNTCTGGATCTSGVITLYSTDGTSTSCVDSIAGGGCDDTEQTLDMTQALGLAPGLAHLVVFVGSSDAAIFSKMATYSPLPLQLSSSWTWFAADPSTDGPFFKEFAAQGQNLFQASGDSGKWTTTSEIYPADDPYVTSVGGTNLSTSGAAGAWSVENAWADGGGGISPDKFAIPSWQVTTAGKCANCSQSYRNGPDVAANSNFSYYVCADQTRCTANAYGGTSFAAPLWAGYLALVNQQRATSGDGPLGFINPTLYSIGNAGSTTYSTAFHDVANGGNGYQAITGFDLATGWGSPNGTGLLNALAPGFTLSASPASLSVTAGNSGSTTITSAVTGGFNSPESLSASGQPTGVTISFSAGSITGAGSSTMSISAATTVAAGTYTITVTGTSGSITGSTAVTLTVNPAPGFTLSASPASLSIAAGNSGSATITSAVTGGFDSPESLSASGQPSGVTISFSGASITGTGSSTMSIAAGSTVAAGTYTITVTGTSGSITESTTVILTVNPAPGFTLSASPASLSVTAGSSGSTTITSAVTGGFNSPESLSASGQPTGVTISFSGASITGPGSSTMSIAAASTVAAGAYTITVTGTSGSMIESTAVTLTVNPAGPGFTLSASPASLSITAGSSGSTTITGATTGGFNSAASLSVSGQPKGVTFTFSSMSITGNGSSTLTIAVGSTVAAGTYTITVTGFHGSITDSTTVTLTVNPASGFTLSASPASLSIAAGNSGSTTITSAVTGGFNSPESLSASGQPSGVTIGFSGASITGPGSSTMSIAVASTVAVGTYTITVTGTSGSITESTAVTLTVNAAPGFTLSASPASLTVTAGSSSSATISSAVTGGFNSPESLSASGQPTGVTISFSAVSITGAGSSPISIAVDSTVAAGTYTITVTGTSGSIFESTTITLTVNPAFGFTLGASPASLSIAAGSSGSTTFTIAATGGFNSAASLSISAQAKGVIFTFSSMSITGTGSSTLTMAVGSTVAAGTYTITVTGSHGSNTSSTTITLTVTPAPGFSISFSPTPAALDHGRSGYATVATTNAGALYSAIALTLRGLPSGVTASSSTASIASPGTDSAQLNLTVPATAQTGAYPITVAGRAA
jgi:subtilase family serine protease